MKNGFPAPNKKLAINQKQLLDRKGPIQVRIRLPPALSLRGICISRMVRDQIRDKLPYAFEDLGEQSVKNIARPVRVYARGLEPVGFARADSATACHDNFAARCCATSVDCRAAFHQSEQ